MHPQTTFESEQTQQPSWQEFPEAHGEQGKTQQVKEGIRQAGMETARRAKEQGEAFFGEQKHVMSESIHHCGEALRGAAEHLRSKQDSNLASLTESIAGQLEKASGYLEGKQLQDLRNDVEDLARRQPTVFYGAMFVAGLALSRFLKASQSRPRGRHHQGKPEFAPESSVSPENVAMNPI